MQNGAATDGRVTGGQVTGALRNAALLAFITPLWLLAGAYIGQYVFDLYPCEMCWWQRYPHFAALALMIPGLFLLRQDKTFQLRALTLLAAVAILISGLIGGYHAGVEYRWWAGVTECTSALEIADGADFWQEMMNAPVVRCDRPAFTLFGISLAGYNFLISTASALLIFGLLRNRERSGVSRVSNRGAQI